MVDTGQTVLQTVTTVVGLTYYVANAGGSFVTHTITAQPSAGGAADGTKSGSGLFGNVRVGFLFEATSTSTNIVLSGVPVGPSGGTITFDDAVPTSCRRRSLPGAYAGTASTVIAIDPLPLSNLINRRVVARITADSRLFIIDGASIHAGLILNDGTFDLALNPPPAGLKEPGDEDGDRKGRRLTLTFPGAGCLG